MPSLRAWVAWDADGASVAVYCELQILWNCGNAEHYGFGG